MSSSYRTAKLPSKKMLSGKNPQLRRKLSNKRPKVLAPKKIDPDKTETILGFRV